ncbi:MAG: iron-sulfur cluster assembly scaffold protein [Candidatus Moraniibacteriota bacterium]
MSLYQDRILDHYHHPRHFGTLEHKTGSAEALNPTCGDRLAMDIRIEDARIGDIAFSGAGCAISLASASLLSEHVSGMSRDEALALEPQDVLKLLEVSLSPGRLKCGILSLEVLKKALHNT